MDNHKIKTSHKISLRVHKITSIACSCTHHGHDFAHELNTHTYSHTHTTHTNTHTQNNAFAMEKFHHNIHLGMITAVCM